jgi:hypothetical protein
MTVVVASVAAIEDRSPDERAATGAALEELPLQLESNANARIPEDVLNTFAMAAPLW